MEIRQLKYFLAVVDCGSVSRAAQQVFVAPSALSKQISALESELSVELLTRGRSGATTTEAGQVFYGYARAIQKQIAEAKAAVHFSPDSVVGTIVVALPQSVADTLALELIRAARERLPNVSLHINEELAGNMMDQVRQGRVDIGIFTSNVPSSDFNFEALVEEDFCLIHAPSYENAPGGGDISLAQAASHPLVLPGSQHHHCTRLLIERAMATAGLGNLRVAIEVNSVRTLKSVVEAGLATTIMPLALAAEEVRSGRFVAHRIDAPGISRVLGLCTSRLTSTTRPKRAVSSLIVEVAETLCSTGKWEGARVVRQELVHEDV